MNADSLWLCSGFVTLSQNLIVLNFASRCIGTWPNSARHAEFVAVVRLENFQKHLKLSLDNCRAERFQ